MGLGIALVMPWGALAGDRQALVDRWGLPVEAAGAAVERSGTPPAVTARWGYADFGGCVGRSNIVLAGREIYVGSLARPNIGFFYVVRPDGPAYAQAFVSPSMPGIVRLAVGNVVGDEAKEIVVARNDGTIVLFDQRTRAELGTLVTAAREVAGMALYDLYGDAKAEIILTTTIFGGNTLWILNETGEPIWLLPDAGGADVVVANMDDDPSPEIATTSGAVIDWATLSVQWQRSQPFGFSLEVGDIDADGRQELISENGGSVLSYDVDLQTTKWTRQMFDVDAIWVGNVDDDPEPELLVGDGQGGGIHAIDVVTLVELWAIPNPQSGVEAIAVGDANADGTLDLFWGAGCRSTGPDRLYVANLRTLTIDWESVQLDGPFLDPKRGDIDGDGRPELVTASTESDAGYSGGRIVALDAATLQFRGISGPVGGISSTGTHDLELRNVDTDPQLEVVVATDHGYDGVIEIYDFIPLARTFVLKWTNPLQPDGTAVYAVDVADVDADGQLEIVAGTGGYGPGGKRIYVYSYPSGQEEWRSPLLTTHYPPVSGLAVLTAGGGVADIVAMVDGESLNFFTGTGQAEGTLSEAFSFLVPDAMSGTRGFLAGLQDGTVRRYEHDPAGYVETWARDFGSSEIEGVTMLANGSMSVAAGGRLTFYPDRDAPPAWLSEDYGVHGGVVLGDGVENKPFAAGAYGVVSLAPWLPLRDVQPGRGFYGGGTPIAAFGTAFDPNARLYVGSREVSNPQVSDPTIMTGTTPALTPCSVNAVAVVNPDMSFEVMDDAFTASHRFGLPPCNSRPALATEDRE